MVLRTLKGLLLVGVISTTLAVSLALTIPLIVYAAVIISEPSFETVTIGTWDYTETDADYTDGVQSTAWKTQGSYSYLLSCTNMNLANGKHSEVTQTIDFTSIDTISFDARLQGDAGTCEARVLIGSTTEWSQTLTVTAINYLHNEVDVSGYTGSQDLVLQTYATATHNNANITVYYDNIKIWGSYSNLGRTTVSNNFTSTSDIVYAYGENFDTTGTYYVAYYDGGGTKLKTDTYTNDADGILDASQITPSDYGSSTAGTWHSVIYKTNAPPLTYASVSTGDADYVIQDSFTVQASAIPEFPSPVTAIIVLGVCFGIYYLMRKRRMAYVKA